jgi:signal transduction histidine kinase
VAAYGIRKYIGIVFMAAIIVPAVILSLLAIRAISHEEAYIEKQLEGTLTADVTHVASVVATEMDAMQNELAAADAPPETGDPSNVFEAWKRTSALVEIPFLLSPEHHILWPAATRSAAEKSETKEDSFAAEQEAFFSDREEILVYENIAVAFQDEILGEADESTVYESEEAPSARTEALVDAAESVAGAGERAAAERERAYDPTLPGSVPEVTGRAAPQAKGVETKKQSAIAEFQRSEEVRQKVFDRADDEGQKVMLRNVAPSQVGEEYLAEEAGAAAEEEAVEPTAPAHDMAAGDTRDKGREVPATRESGLDSDEKRPEAPRAGQAGAVGPAGAGRIRSIFVEQPLSFSEIVADRQSGIIPRTIDGALRHIYWRRLPGGRIMGCLIDSGAFRERIVGALPNIYSPVRILTVLDESGNPLILPQGEEGRDWQRPFVAVEISELLPRWESAAYLTAPDAITSRARATTTVMWILILILFVSILTGSVLVLRSAYAEVRLARQRTSFVANVSHELKTPLTSIRMFAEMLRDGRQADPEKQKHYLEVMTAETERLTRLINNVLDFSRMERGEKRYNMRTCDLVALARDVVESERARLEQNGFEVKFTTRSGILEVGADEEAIKQTVVNLLSNAEKYSPDVRQIEMDVGHDEGRAVVSISDRGIGIPSGEVRNIFDEFYRVDDSLTSEVKGAGLGLTIARKIIADHGGDIRYAAREGGGSTFSIVLPLAGVEGQD